MSDPKSDAPEQEEAVAVPAWLLAELAAVAREALALWFDPEGHPIGFLPNDCFSYHVPVATGDAPTDAVHAFFARRRGDVFLPLYRAAYGLQTTMMHDDGAAAIVAAPSGEGPET